MERDLGIKAKVIKKALSVSIEAHKSPEKPCLVKRKIPNSPSQVIVAFPGSWSLNDWFSGDSKATPFGETKIDTKKFGSLKSIGKEVEAMVNEAFMARFLRILDDGSGTFRAEVFLKSRMMLCFRCCFNASKSGSISQTAFKAISRVLQVSFEEQKT